jgi:putative acetyltransferase
VWEIRSDDLSGHAVRALITEHLAHMHSQTPPESVHALDLSALQLPSVMVFTAWNGATLGGMGALQRLDARRGEVKSMRTTGAARGKGAGRALVQHITGVARTEGLTSLWLETGADHNFAAARGLYISEGFRECGPFAGYTDDPLSVFMTREI